MKMNALYTAIYSDGRTAHEKTLEWIYSNMRGARVEIRPCIWVWKASVAQIFFVDFVGASVGCTLKTFDNLVKANAYAAQIGRMDETEFAGYLMQLRLDRIGA